MSLKNSPNIYIDRDVDKIALGIARLADKRHREILESKKKQSIHGIVKSVINTARQISEARKLRVKYASVVS